MADIIIPTKAPTKICLFLLLKLSAIVPANRVCKVREKAKLVKTTNAMKILLLLNAKFMITIKSFSPGSKNMIQTINSSSLKFTSLSIKLWMMNLKW